MSPQVIVLVGCVLIAAALVLAVVAIATVPPVDRSKAVANLRRGQAVEVAAATPRKRSAAEGTLVARLVPAPAAALLDRQHQRAGRPASFVLSRLLLGKAIWPFAAIAIIALVALRGEPRLTLLALVVAVVVYFVPDLLLLSRGQERDQAIQKALPDTLDQMLIGVDAGLGFDAAMSRTAANGSGPLAEELTRTLQDVRMGRSRREAFEQLVERTKVPDLRQFVRAILQADAYGISVTDVLRTQAAEMRRRRRQRAEEQAQKVPVKVLMPLMLCILPVLFIVVLGPAAFGIVEAFSGM